MPTTTAAALIDPLADLRQAYIARLRNRVDGLAQFLDVCRDGAPDEAMYAEYHRCVHSMISSAAIFGHARLSTLARAAERAFEARVEHGETMLVRQIEVLVREAEDVLGSTEHQ